MTSVAARGPAGLLAVLGVCLVLGVGCAAPRSGGDAALGGEAADEVAQGFDKVVARIAARDGIELNTEIYVPSAEPPAGGWPPVA